MQCMRRDVQSHQLATSAHFYQHVKMLYIYLGILTLLESNKTWETHMYRSGEL